MDINLILPRNEVPDEYKWNIRDLYENEEAFFSDIRELEKRINRIKEIENKVFLDGVSLFKYYSFIEDTYIILENIHSYANRNRDTDITNPAFQDYKDRVDKLFVKFNSATAFFEPELMSISEQVLSDFYASCKELLYYKADVDEKRRLKAHILDKKTEEILALSGEATSLANDIFGTLTYSDLLFDDVSVNGENKKVTQSTFVTLLQNNDRSVRKAAFKSFYKAYEQFKNTFATALAGQIKKLGFYANVRGYSSTLAAALDGPNVNISVYFNLINAVHDNIDYMHRYVALRKKALGVKELHMYDIYAPLCKNSDNTITFSQAKENVINATRIFGSEYTDILLEGFNNGWIDIYENTGKRSGAYSSSARVHPFVLLNHKDNLDSEFTLAHEMGHAMHTYFSNKNQSPVYSDYTIFVAEVASTCNEALLMQYLLKSTKDKRERAALINHFLEQFKGTLYRQTMFAEFELSINEMHSNGNSLTAEVLCQKYRELNEFYFGKDIVIDDEIALEWARIPHFYYNYYVYQYATGFSAAIALSTKILNEGKPAVERYLNFLKSGCTKDPITLLKDAGVDLSTPEPVTTALKLFGELIDEMEGLLDD